ncbi:sulfite exporter TauE/SafE family protein [Poseidonocella sedimentorum]|uniref:Probable membrane transporter protein n=1 Tax=Poseidonocella sedimentorum TaxID=871652 RepID=A0A1I6D3F3_9RHOB|nr:sulfite exporter TauE/SafE family protein [Poseidonocella sedimentorum]SFQ99891.1 hypothetical protein SAMN04515673_10247 [Poseidonocella sedimentorum]
MDILADLLSPLALLIALGVALFAGVIKGLVGFAMPMIMISGLSSVMAPELALAALIGPTLVTNLLQAFGEGWRAFVQTAKRFRIFLLMGLVMLLLAAQLVSLLPQNLLLLFIAVPIILFAALQLAGVPLVLRRATPTIEAIVGAFAGFIGGLSGVWGPPTVAYLSALNTEKREHIRTQGVIYGLGAIALVFAHIGSGVLTAKTAPLSIVMILPALVGMYVGRKLQDRIDQDTFRRATLLVLLIAGMNLLRRGLFA